MERIAWIRVVGLAVADTLPQLSTPARALVVAHAAFESGFGVAYAAENGNNLFNITSCQGKPGCNDGWHGEVLQQADADWEYHKDGSKTRIAQTWRKYNSLQESISDYWNFLGRPRYAAKGVQEALTGGYPLAFAEALFAGGYFTLPVDQYASKLAGVLAQVTAALEFPSVS